MITTNTLSSAHLAEIELQRFNNIEHRFFPIDVNFVVKKFLALWKPDFIFFVDSEIWPNLIIQAKKLDIPLGLINARLTERSFKRWMIFPHTAKKIFGFFDLFLCSNSETKIFLEKLNLKNILFYGNLKLINQISKDKIININKDVLLKKNFWIAASTHEGEDLFCLKTHINLKKKIDKLITIIAPRHPERSHKIKSLFEKHNLTVQILNKDELILDSKEIIIINYFGALRNYFKYAKSVFIGKSMIKKLKNDGGQDPIEAAKLNCKIYHGPYVRNFYEIYEILMKNNISKQINSEEELSKNLIEDLSQSHEQKKMIKSPLNDLGQKTLLNTIKTIEKFLFNENK